MHGGEREAHDEEKAHPAARALGRVTATKVMTPISLATALFFRRWPGASRLATASVIAAATSETLKAIFPRERPKKEAEDPEESFPSGHAASGTVLALGLATMMPGRAQVGAIALGVAAVVAIDAARRHEREHHVSDVVVGNAIGLVALGAAHLLTRSSWWRRNVPSW